MTKYPAQIDNSITLPTVADNISSVSGETVNRLRNAILAIESELGVKPSGVYTTVRSRLDNLDTAISNLEISGLSGDVEGALSSTKVIGLGGRPFSDQQPEMNQVVSWNGIAWVPSSQSNVVLNVLPTTVVLPVDINFLVGEAVSVSATPSRAGAREIDTDLYPSTYPDGRFRTLTFKADLQVTNGSTVGHVRIRDMVNNVVIVNTDLSTNSTTPIELSAQVFSGIIDGYFREDSTPMYEAQIYVTGGNGTTDQVICKNIRIEVTYSPPILVSALVPLALPTDIEFICGLASNGFNTPLAVGGRTLDMTKFGITLPDGRIREVNFIVDVEISAPGFDGYIQLWDATHGVLVTNSRFRFTNAVATEVSATLTVGTSNGTIRTDQITRYEVQVWKIGGSVTDRAICNNARIEITYS